MRRMQLWGLALVLGLLIEGSVAWTADGPATRTVLSQLHRANQNEISLGKLAQRRGRSDEVKSFGRTLVIDHESLDQMVVGLARLQNVELASTTSTAKGGAKTGELTDAELTDLAYSATFDTTFARMMFEDHGRAITSLSAARDATHDEQLRKLLDEQLPILRNHRDLAQKILDATPRALL